MDINEAEKLITNEGLGRYNFGNHTIRENEVGIKHEKNKFTVYSTDERASLRIIEAFAAESDAIDRVIECLRVNKRIADLRSERRF